MKRAAYGNSSSRANAVEYYKKINSLSGLKRMAKALALNRNVPAVGPQPRAYRRLGRRAHTVADLVKARHDKGLGACFIRRAQDLVVVAAGHQLDGAQSRGDGGPRRQGGRHLVQVDADHQPVGARHMVGIRQ